VADFWSRSVGEANANARLEAFCDGVFAIALTLLIIDIRLPDIDGIHSTPELWRALRALGPAVFAFVLSFVVVFITWVNHHNALKLVNRSATSFVYANGLLLLTIVFLPFPTSLLGAFILTDHAAPAVVLYDAVLVVQALAWLLMIRSALNNQLLKNEHSRSRSLENQRNAILAMALYSLLAVTALWQPVGVAIVTTTTWVFWLVLGIRLKQHD
jgi:uncharacterized membrane protein